MPIYQRIMVLPSNSTIVPSQPQGKGAKCFYHIYSRYWWTSLILYWCLIHLKAVLVCNWCSKSTRFMPMGIKLHWLCVIDLKVAVIPLKDFYLTFNWISSAGCRETKREDLTCLTLSVSCHPPIIRCHAFRTVLSVKVMSLCEDKLLWRCTVPWHEMAILWYFGIHYTLKIKVLLKVIQAMP